MATYKGNVIGTSKVQGLFSKFSEEGIEKRLEQYGITTELYGVSKVPWATRPSDHGVNSTVVNKDFIDLTNDPDVGNKYGEVVSARALARQDALEVFGITSASHGEQERSTIAGVESERVAKLYDNENNQYFNRKNKDSYRIGTNRESSQKVIDYYGTSKANLDDNGYLVQEGHAGEFFKKKFPLLEPTTDTWVESEPENYKTVKLPKVRNTHARDKMEEFLYENIKEPDVDVQADLEWKSDSLLKDLSLVPFCITTITPDHRTYLNFPAYLDSYDDQYDGEWDSVQYIGRADRFWGYKGFSRSINIGFKIAARSRDHLIPIYKKLNRLVGATAPSYGEDARFMRGTLASISIGGYKGLLPEQLGVIQNVKLSWKQDYLWELGDGTTVEEGAITYGKAGESIIVPQVLDVSLSLRAIEKQEAREDYGAYMVWNPRERVSLPSMPSLQAPAVTKDPGLAQIRPTLPKFDKPEPQQISTQRDVTVTQTTNQGGARGYGNYRRNYDSVAPGAAEIASQQLAQFGL